MLKMKLASNYNCQPVSGFGCILKVILPTASLPLRYGDVNRMDPANVNVNEKRFPL